MKAKEREAGRELVQRCRVGLEKGNSISDEEIKELQSALDLLEKCLGEVRATSENSHLPPSADLGRKTKEKEKSTRKTGGQPGHAGTTLQFVDEPDEVKELKLDVIPAGYKIVGYERRQVTELYTKRRIVEYRSFIYEDENGNRITVPFPKSVQRKVQYGNSVKGAVVYMSGAQMMPYNRIQEMLSEQAGIPISEGTVYNFLEDAHARLEDFERWAVYRLLYAGLVHFDETGIRISGSRQWLHNASTSWVTLFMPHHKRGQEAMDAMGILPSFTGIAVHDFWASYFNYDCQHSVCMAHISRELNGCHERDGSKWSLDMQRFLCEANEAKLEGKLTPEGIEARKKEFEQILKQGEQECPATEPGKNKKRGRVAQGKSRNLLNRLREYSTEVLRFMESPDVPFTNNQAERDVRMTKVQQKISGCFRSMNGARFFCRIRSYISTCRKNGISPTQAVSDLFAGKLPDFINMSDIPEDFKPDSLPNDKPKPDPQMDEAASSEIGADTESIVSVESSSEPSPAE